MGHAAGGAAILVAGEVAVQISAVAKIAAAAAKAVQVDDGNTDHGAGQLVGLQLVHQAPHHLDTVELITMDGSGEAQLRAGFGAMGDQHRHRCGNRAERLIRGPVQGGKGARIHYPVKQRQRLGRLLGGLGVFGHRLYRYMTRLVQRRILFLLLPLQGPFLIFHFGCQGGLEGQHQGKQYAQIADRCSHNHSCDGLAELIQFVPAGIGAFQCLL